MQILSRFSTLHKRIRPDFTQGEIEEARLSPGFEREYNLQYGFGIGNVFLTDQIVNVLIAVLDTS